MVFFVLDFVVIFFNINFFFYIFWIGLIFFLFRWLEKVLFINLFSCVKFNFLGIYGFKVLKFGCLWNKVWSV